MNKDVVPELLEKINQEYEKRIELNNRVQNYLKKIDNQTIKEDEVSLYGDELGECAAKAFLKYVNEDNLPDGKLYWNIAERIINELLTDVYERVNDAAELVQKRNDKENNINIKPQRAGYPSDRIRDLVDKAIYYFEGGDVDYE